MHALLKRMSLLDPEARRATAVGATAGGASRIGRLQVEELEIGKLTVRDPDRRLDT